MTPQLGWLQGCLLSADASYFASKRLNFPVLHLITRCQMAQRILHQLHKQTPQRGLQTETTWRAYTAGNLAVWLGTWDFHEEMINNWMRERCLLVRLMRAKE